MGRFEIVIRSAASRDAPTLCSLAAELGYPASTEDMAARLDCLLEVPGHGVLVAEYAGAGIIGWVHVFGAYRVESDPCAEIGGLVVAERYRGNGAGARLVNAAEKWAAENGFGTLKVRCRKERNGAHAFYESLGFACSKTQKVFERSVKGDP